MSACNQLRAATRLFAAACGVIAVATHSLQAAPKSAPTTSGWIRQATYLGPENCRECHADRVHKFEPTAHFRAARLPASGDFKGSFKPGSNVYQSRDSKVRYEMTQEGTNYFQTRIEQTTSGERRERHEVAMIYGTGLLDEVYLYWQGTRAMEMPIAHVEPLKRWINAPGFVDGRADFSHSAGLCINCHNTHMKVVENVPFEFHREGAVLSISCEKCHGPGSWHSEHHRAFPNEKEGKFIANPSALSRKQQIDLCSECHSDLGQPRQPLFSFKPGDKLEDFYVVPGFVRDRENQHTANHIRYLEQSKCFQKSQTLSCITCHNPHIPEGPANALSVKKSCLQCHQPENCTERPELPLTVRDSCIDCHMPERVEMLTPFQGPDGLFSPGRKRHEHKIAVDHIATDQILARHFRGQAGDASKQKADQLAASLAQRLTTLAKDLESQKQLANAMSSLRDALEFAVDTNSIAAAMKDLSLRRERVMVGMDSALVALNLGDARTAISGIEKVLAINPKIPVAHHHLGRAYQLLNDHTQAMQLFNKALSLDAEMPESLGHLGLSSHVLKNYDAAIEFYQKALEMEPRSSETHNNLGLAFRAKGDNERALAEYNLAIQFDRRNASAYSNLGALLQRLGRIPEAISAFRNAVEARPDNGEAQFNLANILRQSGDLEGSIRSYKAAVEAAKHPGALNNLAMLLTMTGQHAEAVPYYESILKERPDSVPHLVFLSRTLSTLEPGKGRNVSRALELATRAATLTNGQEPNSLDAVALAQAASGNFAKATEAGSRALSIATQAGDAQFAGVLRNRMDVYKRKEVPAADSVFPKPGR